MRLSRRLTVSVYEIIASSMLAAVTQRSTETAHIVYCVLPTDDTTGQALVAVSPTTNSKIQLSKELFGKHHSCISVK